MTILLAHVKRISALCRTERTWRLERKEVTEKGVKNKGKQERFQRVIKYL